MQTKKEPLRMCLSCRQMKDKHELIRFVKSGDKIEIDPSFKAAGRGAYVCNSAQCKGRLVKARLLNKAFKCDVPAEIYEKVGKIDEQ